MALLWRNIDDWFQILLLDRFGLSFQFERLENNQLKLTLKGYPNQSILFDNIDPVFYDSNLVSNLKFQYWNAKDEGFSTKIHEYLPLPFGNNVQMPIVKSDNGSMLIISYDILGLAYWMLNRVEEFRAHPLDNHNRFPAIASHAYQHGYLERPIVDEWLDVFKQLINRIFPNAIVKKHTFLQYISHDVDRPSKFQFANLNKFIRAVGHEVLREKNYFSIFKAPYIKLLKPRVLSPLDPYNTFKWIMDTVEKNNLKSAFYFICGGKNQLDADYNLSNLEIINLLKDIHNRGHEIGLHPSYETYLNPTEIADEFQVLKDTCHKLDIRQREWGGRMHYLRWQQNITLDACNEAGLNYDSTLCYAEHAGFRCGTCYQFRAFNHQTQQVLDLIIRPLIIMEATVFYYEKYGITDEAYARMLKFKRICQAIDGQFTLLWHNNEFVKPKARKIFEDILKN